MRVISNRVAFVTGGASGIGLGIVRRLLAHGVNVMAADLRADHLAEARSLIGPSERVDFLQVDVSSREAMAAAAQACQARFGAVHILVNNAGVGTCPSPEQMTHSDWDWVLSVNLGGTINGIMSFLPLMLAHGEGGHILSTASMAALLPTANNRSGEANARGRPPRGDAGRPPSRRGVEQALIRSPPRSMALMADNSITTGQETLGGKCPR